MKIKAKIIRFGAIGVEIELLDILDTNISSCHRINVRLDVPYGLIDSEKRQGDICLLDLLANS